MAHGSSGLRDRASSMCRAPAPLPASPLTCPLAPALHHPHQPPTGGELILTVFEKRLPDSIEKQPFKKILEVPYVKRIIEEADGIQPHLVAPEAGYRRLLEEALGYLKDPTEKSVEEVRLAGLGWLVAGCLGRLGLVASWAGWERLCRGAGGCRGAALALLLLLGAASPPTPCPSTPSCTHTHPTNATRCLCCCAAWWTTSPTATTWRR